jgi:hypothetical protein
MDELELRTMYLTKLNKVIELSIVILSGNWVYSNITVNMAREELIALGQVTSLQKCAEVERIGWYVGNLGTYGGLEMVGNALIHVAEHYRSSRPTGWRDFAQADEHITALEHLTVGRKA